MRSGAPPSAAPRRKDSDGSRRSDGSSAESTPAPSIDSLSPQAAPLAGEPADAVCDGGRVSAVAAGVGSIAQLRARAGATVVTALDVSDNALTSLAGLELFPRLETLVLDNNNLASLDDLPDLRGLTTLWLNNNQLADLDTILDPLAEHAPGLRYLSLLGNAAARSPLLGCSKEEAERYRAYVIHRLPSLQLLDAAPVLAAERQLAKERGKFLRVAKPRVSNEAAAAVEPNKFYAPGEKAGDRSGSHAGYFGRQRRFYSGKYSEGNRFIRDNAL